MEEYALDSFSEIAEKDPGRLFDLGNNAQILADMVGGNKNSERKRAEQNILHALGKPYTVKEVVFNTLTNLSPLAVGGLIKVLGKGSLAASKGLKAVQGMKRGNAVKNVGKTGYYLSRKEADPLSDRANRTDYTQDFVKPFVLGMLNLDLEDPARFNQSDVELAYKTLYGEQGWEEAMEEGLTPRQLIRDIHQTIMEYPEIKEDVQRRFLESKEKGL